MISSIKSILNKRPKDKLQHQQQQHRSQKSQQQQQQQSEEDKQFQKEELNHYLTN